MTRASTCIFLAAALFTFPKLAFPEARVTLVRIQGNYRLTDAAVLHIAGIEIGDPYRPSLPAEVEERLASSGRFDDVDVRVRYRGLEESEDVALVLIVEERVPIESKFMVAPIFDLSDEYGVTYGATPALVDIGLEGGRIGFPLSWGGAREAGIEGELPIQKIGFELTRSRRVNPHYDAPDNRFEVGASAGARRGLTTANVRGRFSDVDFDRLEERFLSVGAGVKLDSRIDPTVPGDAYYVGLDWRRLFFLEGASSSDVNQLTVDLRGYKRLVGQSLFTVQALYRVADGPLPRYEQPFLGGGQTLRGYEPGHFIGDSAAWGSVELRVPLTSPRSMVRAGVHTFFDIGAVHDYGKSLRSARFHQGAGVGAFFRFAFIGVRLDLGWALEGGTRVHVSSTMKF